MIDEWLLLIKEFKKEGARARFEEICSTLFKNIYINKYVKTVRLSQGDGGIDIFIGEIGSEPIEVIQCKFFPEFGESQKNQIRESFNTVINSKEFVTKNWTLCIINEFNIDEHKWWLKWKKGVIKKYNLDDDFIDLNDGKDLINLLKKHNIYDITFGIDYKNQINEIHNHITGKETIPQIDVRKCLIDASYALLQIRNYIQDKTNTHILRNEPQVIYDWIISELPEKQKNVLILKGEKGLGKSVILKDLYEKLANENYKVLAIKADKFYAKSIDELEEKLFSGKIKFDKLISFAEIQDEKLIIIIDQIDALSLTLSSSREFIETYNRLISLLHNSKQVRVIISSRTFDLKYDAELSIYNSNEYKKISVHLLTLDDVKNTLMLFNINCSSTKVLELLRVPNNLDIYCRTFENSPVKNINSLKELYDELWKKHISASRNLRLKNLIYIIAQRMYLEQRISVGNIYEDEFFAEILYLKSNNLLIEFNNEIQFFHQTFYEYIFARQFVENKENLEDYLIENEQSLYVRSVIKMVLEYLREYDIKKYVQTIENILNQDIYRFHVKSLVINNLGLIQHPTIKEKAIVKNIILKHKNYEEVFINSIYSNGWIIFLISERIPEDYFFVERKETDTDEDYSFKKDKMFNYNWFLFRNNMNTSSREILQYLDSIEFENKNYFIAQLLTQIDDWTNEGLISYFEKYIPFEENTINRRENLWFFKVLKRIFPINKDYVYDKLALPILEVYKDVDFRYDFDHSLNSTIEELYKLSPEDTFEFLLRTFLQISEDTPAPYFNYEKIESPLYLNPKILKSERRIIRNGEKNIKDHLINSVIELKEEDIFKLYKKFKESNNIAILELLIRALNTNTSKFKNEVLEIIKILNEKNIFSGSDDNFQLQLRKLISNTYKHFSKDEKTLVNGILLNIRTTHDYWIHKNHAGKKTIYQKNFALKKYLFIKSLPLGDIIEFQPIYKVYQELKRKFGEINHLKALHVSEGGGGIVGPPLNQSAYQNMNIESWKRSMIKFNEDYKSNQFLKGGIFEHCQAFKDSVKENPEKFHELVDELFEDKRISNQYLTWGIIGLIEGNYDAEKVKILYKKFLSYDHDVLNYECIIYHQAEYFIKNKNIDKDIILYLQNVVLNYKEEKSENNNETFEHAINTVRGSALYQLMHCDYDKEFVEIIFSTIEIIIEDETCDNSIRSMIVYNLAYLNHFDIERSYKIFTKLTDTDNKSIIKSSLNSAQYFNHKYHTEMKSYFNRILEERELDKEKFILVSSWLFNLDEKKELYQKFVSTGQEAKLCALHVAEKFLINNDGEINEKALSILFDFITETDKEFAQEYSSIILRKFKIKDFKSLISFLDSYSKSIVCKKHPSYFLDYLIKCSKDYPKECMELVNNIDFSPTPNIQEMGYYDKEPVQLILGIYSKLVSEINKDKSLINKALDVFDNMLKQNHLRANAYEAIETLI
nr:ATP-binding protein [uncultured Chryseobacterium sp.]